MCRKIFLLVFDNGSNYDYHFIIKELAQKIFLKNACLGENSKKYITFAIPIEKEITRIDKNGEVYIICLTCYSLLIVQDLWQVHDQISSMIVKKRFIELNVNTDTMIKNVKHVELNISIATAFSNIRTLR